MLSLQRRPPNRSKLDNNACSADVNPYFGEKCFVSMSMRKTGTRKPCMYSQGGTCTRRVRKAKQNSLSSIRKCLENMSPLRTNEWEKIWIYSLINLFKPGHETTLVCTCICPDCIVLYSHSHVKHNA